MDISLLVLALVAVLESVASQMANELDFGNNRRGFQSQFARQGAQDFGRQGAQDFGRQGAQDFGRQGALDFGRQGALDFGRQGAQDFGRLGTQDFSRQRPQEFGRQGTHSFGGGQNSHQMDGRTDMRGIGMALRGDTRGPTDMGVHSGFTGGSQVDFFNRNLQLDTIASGSNFAPEAAQAFPSTFDRSGSRSFVPARVQDDPDFVRSILGSTVAGRELRMGEMGLPRHGGAGRGEVHANGLLDGWDGNPQTLVRQFRGGNGPQWRDPFQGAPVPRLPPGFNGNFGSLRGFRRRRFA